MSGKCCVFPLFIFRHILFPPYLVWSAGGEREKERGVSSPFCVFGLFASAYPWTALSLALFPVLGSFGFFMQLPLSPFAVVILFSLSLAHTTHNTHKFTK